MCIKCEILNLSISFDNLEPEFERIAKLMYAGKLKPGQISAEMVRKIAKQLMQGVTKGIGKSTIEPSFLKQIETNVFIFSGFKNHAQLKEASLLLKDENGSLKPFKQFLNDILPINQTYNEVYALAEYNNALASSQAIASWNDFQNAGIGKLKFQTAGDDRVRFDHALLNNTVVEIGDPMLDTYFTPLDWNCRCEWVPADDEPLTGFAKKDLPEVPPMFASNVGKTGIVFPDTHPYFNVSKEVAKQVVEQVAEILPEGKQLTEKIGYYEKELGVKINKSIFQFLKEDVEISHKKDGSYFLSQYNRVNIDLTEQLNFSKWDAQAVVYHEFGHVADFQNGFSKLSDVGKLMDVAIKRYKPHFYEIHNTLDTLNKKIKDGKTKDQIASVADTLMSLNPNFGWGHTKSYFNLPGMKKAEFIAHAFEIKFAGNDVFKEIMPQLYNEMIDLIDLFKKNIR